MSPGPLPPGVLSLAKEIHTSTSKEQVGPMHQCEPVHGKEEGPVHRLKAGMGG